MCGRLCKIGQLVLSVKFTADWVDARASAMGAITGQFLRESLGARASVMGAITGQFGARALV